MLAGSTNQERFKSVHSNTYPVVVHECNLLLNLGKNKFQLLLGWADQIPYIQRPASNFRSRKKGISQTDCSPIHAVVMLLYGTLESTYGYDMVIRRSWVTAADKDIVTLDSL